MKTRMYVRAVIATACSLGLVIATSHAQEQEPQSRASAGANAQGAAQGSAGHAAGHQVRPGGFRMTLPPESGAIEIVAEGPPEARVNSKIEYRVTLRNVTENLMLHEIVLAEAKSSTAKIESITLENDRQGANAQPADRGRQNPNRRRQNQDPQGENAEQANQNANQNQPQDEAPQPNEERPQNQEENQAQPQNAPQAGDQEQNQRQDDQQGLTSSGDGSWTIDQLGPGQSKTLLVRASADQEGQAMTCLTVRSVQPAICLMTEVTKPEIQITKKAPERASLCEPFEIHYTITNPGTGDIEAFTLRDPLPEGLRLVDEKEELAYKIDGLKAGDTRSFVARVMAERPGDYRSRAEAIAGEDLRARSAEVGTTVTAAQLAVQIDGPSQTYVNRKMTYTAFVTNAGQSPARNATLAIQLPQENLRLIDMGSLRKSDRRVESNPQATGREAEPMPAEAQSAESAERQGEQGQNANQNQPQNQNDPQLAEAQTIEIGDLAPGESRQVAFVVRASKDGTFPVQATTSFVCGDREEDRTQAVAQTQVEVLSLAALAIGVADEQDPIPVGKQATYLISVVNEGTAPDQNVAVTAQVPQNYEFVEGEGQTEVKNEGGTITFAPLDTLGPGDKAEWRVTLQAKQPGNVRFEIDVTSDKSADNVKAAEPTTLFEEK